MPRPTQSRRQSPSGQDGGKAPNPSDAGSPGNAEGKPGETEAASGKIGAEGDKVRSDQGELRESEDGSMESNQEAIDTAGREGVSGPKPGPDGQQEGVSVPGSGQSGSKSQSRERGEENQTGSEGRSGRKPGDPGSEGSSAQAKSPGEGSTEAKAQDGGGDTKSQPPRELGRVGRGSPNAGSGGREGGVSDTLPGATQPAEDVAAPASPRDGAPLQVNGRLDRVVDALERELRSGAADSKLLQELGWDLPRARQFVAEYRRTRGIGQRQSDRTTVPLARRTATRPEDAAGVLYGTATPEARTLRPEVQRRADEMQGLADPARQRVPSRYRPLLEAYYRSITSQPAR
jgi:hypothetical protein